jgi:hypothetical protein
MIEVFVHAHAPFFGSQRTKERVGVIGAGTRSVFLKSDDVHSQLILGLLKDKGISRYQLIGGGYILAEWLLVGILFAERMGPTTCPSKCASV